jgi:hypothetical protein
MQKTWEGQVAGAPSCIVEERTMNRMLAAAVFVLALALAACATPRVYTDHDPSAQFGTYHTYSWREKPDKVPALISQRIVDAVDAQLRAKGWTPVADGGDVAIAAHVATRQEYNVDTFYNDPFWGGWGWRGWGPRWGAGIGYERARVSSYTVGTLVLDMFDAKTKQAIWSGVAEGTVPKDPQKLHADIQTAVAKMFMEFPPGTVTAPR